MHWDVSYRSNGPPFLGRLANQFFAGYIRQQQRPNQMLRGEKCPPPPLTFTSSILFRQTTATFSYEKAGSNTSNKDLSYSARLLLSREPQFILRHCHFPSKMHPHSGQLLFIFCGNISLNHIYHTQKPGGL